MAVGQANQFIGSKISLISKAEIRYEGILYSLDLQESTISLAKVKSYGTEDRPTDKPIGAREDVFEFIIFRGSDIKNIDVVEPPKSATAVASGLPDDPAIIEVSHYNSGPSGVSGNGSTSQRSSQNSNGRQKNNGNNTNIFSNLLAGRSSQNRRNDNNSGPQQNGNQRQPRRRGRSGNRRRRSDSSNYNNGNGSNNNNNGNNNANNNNSGRRRSRGRVDQQRQGGGGNGFQQRNGSGREMRNVMDNGSFFFNPYMQMQMPSFGRGRGDGMFMNRNNFRPFGGRGRGGNRGGSRQQQARGKIDAQQPAKVTFEEEFDFEKSHEELLQVLSEMKVNENDKPKDDNNAELNNGNESPLNEGKGKDDEGAVYYAKENFFDNISCGAMKKEENNSNNGADRRAERKLNAETFGMSENNNGNARNNNGNRRGGGGNFYRNGYGFGYGNYGFGNRYGGFGGGNYPRGGNFGGFRGRGKGFFGRAFYGNAY